MKGTVVRIESWPLYPSDGGPMICCCDVAFIVDEHGKEHRVTLPEGHGVAIGDKAIGTVQP